MEREKVWDQGSGFQQSAHASMTRLTHSSSRFTVATQKPRKKTTFRATFEFLELPKDLEDDFYRENARIFLKGEQERIMREERGVKMVLNNEQVTSMKSPRPPR